MCKKSKKTIIISAVSAILLVVLDQITKWLAVTHLKGKPAFTLIPGVFELKYLENQSAAFGVDPLSILQKIFKFRIFTENPELFLQVKMVFFTILTILVIGLFILAFIRIPQTKRYRAIDIILIFLSAGAIGNFIDRITLNYVVDFFYFVLIDFPIFNVADIYVTCSAFALLLLGIFYYKDDDIEKIFPSKKVKKNEN